MNPWQEWKVKNLAKQEAGQVGFSAVLNPESPKVNNLVQKARMAACEDCPQLLPTKQCRECGCFMPVKTTLLHASCPLGKW